MVITIFNLKNVVIKIKNTEVAIINLNRIVINEMFNNFSVWMEWSY